MALRLLILLTYAKRVHEMPSEEKVIQNNHRFSLVGENNFNYRNGTANFRASNHLTSHLPANTENFLSPSGFNRLCIFPHLYFSITRHLSYMTNEISHISTTFGEGYMC